MKSKSLPGNSPEGNAPTMLKDALSDADAIATFNKMISEFVQHSCAQPQICISSVGDGSFLLKALISPFPLFTSVISEEDWFKILGKINTSTRDSTGLGDLLMGSSSTAVESGSKTPLSDSGTNNLVDPIKDLPSPSPELSSPTHGSSPSSSVSKYLPQKNEDSEGRHPLKVRFHRTGNDKYEVVGSAVSTSSGEALDGTIEQHCRKTHKKAKKAKKHRVSIDLDHIAYMIDESHLVEYHEPMVSSHSVTENGSSETLMSNGNVLVKDLDCSLAKVEKNHNSMDAMATWPTKCDEIYSEDIGEAEASVTHHIWKKKQRRGEPVVKTSYVKRQGTPVTCTIKLRSKSHPILPLPPPTPPPPPSPPPIFAAIKASSAVVPRRNADRLKTRYSAPPSSSPCTHPRRATKSASPQCIRRSRYQPVYIDDDIIVLCPFMNTRSKEASNKDKFCIIKMEDVDNTNIQSSKGTNGKDRMRIIKVENDTDNILNAQKSGVGNGRDKLRVTKTETDILSVPSLQVVKYECGDSEDGLSPDLAASSDLNASHVQQPIRTAPRRRTTSRPKKVRPRAGRRTGERVTSDEELPLDATHTSASNSSPHSQDRAPEELSSVHPHVDAVQRKNSQISSSSVFTGKYEDISERLAAETDSGSLSDGLYIDEEETVLEKSECKSEKRVQCQSGEDREQEKSASNGGDVLFKGEVKCEPVVVEEDSCAVTVKAPYVMTGNEDMVNGSERSESDPNRRTNTLTTHPVDPAVSYRYRMWSNAYRTFCTNPFIVPPDSGQVPQFVRYPSRSMRDVRSVTRDEKCYVKLGLKYEVAVSNPPKEPNERNWKEIYVGDVLWVRWRKNEYWPATAYSISDTAPVKVTVLWINDKTQSTVDYTMVDSFDMAFHIRYDTRRSDPKYVKAVATALRYMGKMGFWECHITAKVYDEIVREEGESFCRHILPEELRKIKEKSKAPKLAKEAKKDDLTKMQRSEEVLQALQAAHFIDIYHRLPLVGNALPLTQQIVDDYQGSTEYASGNLDPLFVDGSMLSFDDSGAFDIDPEVMGSNEIIQWDSDNGVATFGHDAAEASSSDATDDGCVFASNANALDVDIKEVNEEEFPQPFSEIDALRLTSPEKLPPKKRHGARSVTPKPLPKKKRQ